MLIFFPINHLMHRIFPGKTENFSCGKTEKVLFLPRFSLNSCTSTSNGRWEKVFKLFWSFSLKIIQGKVHLLSFNIGYKAWTRIKKQLIVGCELFWLAAFLLRLDDSGAVANLLGGFLLRGKGGALIKQMSQMTFR